MSAWPPRRSVFALLFLLTLLTAACRQQESPAPDALRQTSWKLHAFHPSPTAPAQLVQPTTCVPCYTLAFTAQPGEWRGYSSTNVLAGQYRVGPGDQQVQFTQIQGTELGEVLEGPRFRQALASVSAYEVLAGQQLRLFHGPGEGYLLFHRQ